MTQEEIIEGNKLIAEFMGAEMPSYSKNPQGEIYACVLEINNTRNSYLLLDGKWLSHGNTLQYHSSWDWLMPVVEKILDLNNMQDLYIKITRITETLIYIDIALLFEEVVRFIKWYNSQPK